jgi:nucleotide-binding universal stress UspA family protein
MFSRITVATDGSVLADKALKTAVELAKEKGNFLTILSVIPVTDAGSPEMIGLSRGEASKADNSILKQALDFAADNGVNAKALKLIGHPGPTIIDYLYSNPQDLIVVGHKGVSNLQALLMGSVAYTIANQAPCAVLIVK